jgi:hypothetical protein
MNSSKIGNRIRQFEVTGDISNELFEKLVAFFDIYAQIIENLIEIDRRQLFEDWLGWLNVPVQPYLVERLIAAAYRCVPLPPEIATSEQAEEWASTAARESKRKCCLVWNRRISIWFDERGALVSRSEAVPGKPNVPWIKLSGKTFNFGEELRSVNLVDWQKKPGA